MSFFKKSVSIKLFSNANLRKKLNQVLIKEVDFHQSTKTKPKNSESLEDFAKKTLKNHSRKYILPRTLS